MDLEAPKASRFRPSNWLAKRMHESILQKVTIAVGLFAAEVIQIGTAYFQTNHPQIDEQLILVTC